MPPGVGELIARGVELAVGVAVAGGVAVWVGDGSGVAVRVGWRLAVGTAVLVLPLAFVIGRDWLVAGNVALKTACDDGRQAVISSRTMSQTDR